MSKTLVITGSSRGIGFAMVQQAIQAGHRIYALSRNIQPLKKSDLLNPYAIDLSDENAVVDFANRLKQEGVRIDALINNAGAFKNIPFSETTTAVFESIYRINVFGLASLTRMLLPLINSKGQVLNISSMGGVDGSSKFPGLAAYSSSKGAVNTLTELLAEEYKATGPTFNALALGAVQTEMLAQAFPGLKAPVSADEMARYILKFALEGQQFFNGKILSVSSSTP
jgi:NAD(P)-dependent dehydrogenase (short-subunit alcohol dehydrogenase family)